MQRSDATWLTERLNELAEALGGKAVTAGAVKVWLDALAECKADAVKAALADWPKKNTKMPAPADILRTLREGASDKIEAAAKTRREADAAHDKALAGPFRGANTALARAELAKIKAILHDCSPGLVAGSFQHISGRNNADPKEWALVLKVKQQCHEPISPYQTALYKAALGEAA